LFAKQSEFATKFFLLRVAGSLLLYCLNGIRAFFPKALEVEVRNKLTHWHLSWLLRGVVEFDQLSGIHSQLSGHLNLRMG